MASQARVFCVKSEGVTGVLFMYFWNMKKDGDVLEWCGVPGLECGSSTNSERHAKTFTCETAMTFLNHLSRA